METVGLGVGVAKDPMVAGDADGTKPLPTPEFSLSNTGQVCCSIERIYVDESVYDDNNSVCLVMPRLQAVGNGMDP
jgi:hypothetical protein